MFQNPWGKFAISVLVVLSLGWLWVTRIDELAYHTWHSDKILELGDATSIKDPSSLPHNAYVEIQGILGNKAATLRGLREGSFRIGPYQIRHLVGSKFYIEFDQDKYLNQFTPFTRIDVKGRLVDFGPGSELAKVRTFFKEYHGKEIDQDAKLVVVDETPRSQARYPIFFLITLILVALSLGTAIYGLVKARKKPSEHEKKDH